MKLFRSFLAVILTCVFLLSPAVKSFAATPVYYWVGAEDIDYGLLGGSSIDTTAGHYRSSFVRTSIRTNAGGFAAAGENLNLSSFWFSSRLFSHWVTYNCNSNNDIYQPWLIFTDNGSTRRLILTYNCYAGWPNSGLAYRVYKGNASGTLTQLGGSFAGGVNTDPSTPDKIDVNVSNYGPSGVITVYINSVQVYSYSGDLHTDSNTSIGGALLSSGSDSNGGNYSAWSEGIFSDTITTSLNVAALVPNGTGNTSLWACTGASPAASVNAIINTDSTNCNSSTVGQLQQWTISNLPTGSWAVIAFGLSMRSSDGTSGPSNIQPVVRVGSTDYSATAIPQSIGAQTYQYWWYSNPATSAGWTTGDINATGFNVGVKPQ